MAKTWTFKECFCDFCRDAGKQVRARFDGKTKYGPWANMCQDCWRVHGGGQLGLGRGQLLVIPGEEPTEVAKRMEVEIGNR